ncbi:uncharacterized protein LOC143666778 [Tamandua tetradactyla]|uniref:uncharacterized protein LOC143666778 n=1 Tax=Tamandua tetradactyla TaxID=48850 RepID=UPI0040541BDF
MLLFPPRGRALIVTQVGTHPKGLAGALGCLEVKGVAFLGLAKHLCPTCSTTRTVPVLAAPCALRLAAHGLVCDRDPRLELRSCLPALLASDHKGTIVAVSSGLAAPPQARAWPPAWVCPHPHPRSLLTACAPTPPQVFGRVAEKPAGGTSCPVLRSSLRGELCLGQGTPWGLEPEPIFRAPYDLSGAKAALLLAVIRDRPGAQRDVEALECLCQALGFETTLRIDPAAQVWGSMGLQRTLEERPSRGIFQGLSSTTCKKFTQKSSLHPPCCRLTSLPLGSPDGTSLPGFQLSSVQAFSLLPSSRPQLDPQALPPKVLVSFLDTHHPTALSLLLLMDPTHWDKGELAA